MKTIKLVSKIAAVVLVSILSSASSKAQMSQYKFEQKFNTGFAQIMNGDYAQASTVFEQLHKADKSHGQVSYLLGLTLMKMGKADDLALEALEQATLTYNYQHQQGRVEDKTAPARAFYYLAKVCAYQGKFDAAIQAYRNYMSCIPLASVDHKREIIRAIKQTKSLKEIEITGADITNELATNRL
ncbi:MAG: hypothetical protein ACPGD8_06145 [Flavobacteriales bacterium]